MPPRTEAHAIMSMYEEEFGRNAYGLIEEFRSCVVNTSRTGMWVNLKKLLSTSMPPSCPPATYVADMYELVDLIAAGGMDIPSCLTNFIIIQGLDSRFSHLVKKCEDSDRDAETVYGYSKWDLSQRLKKELDSKVSPGVRPSSSGVSASAVSLSSASLPDSAEEITSLLKKLMTSQH